MGVTLAMMFTMAVGSSAILAVAVSAPDAAPDIGVQATYVGVFTGFVYFVSMFSGSFCTGFIVKYGPIRVLQFSAFVTILGLVAFVVGTPLTTVICAVLLGIGYGPINPANAPVLLKVTNTKNRAFMFSIKQSGVTVGGAFAALMVPIVATWHSWELGIVCIALLGVLSLLILNPLQPNYYSDTTRAVHNWSLIAIIGPVIQILKIPLLRGFSMVGFTFAGVQISVSSFFVVFLVERGFSLIQAGLFFLLVNLGGILGRVAWGSLSDKWLTPKYSLAAIGFVSAASLSIMFMISVSWNVLLLYFFSFILGSCTHGWNGVFLSEVANQAPEGESHNWTGGVQFLIYGGVAILPPIFGVIVVSTSGYTIPFFLIAISCLLASFSLLWLYKTYSEFR